MSGHKRTTITIDEREYARLQEADVQYQRLQRDHASTATLNYYQDALHQEFERISQRQQQYQGWIQGINDQVQKVEGYVSASLSEQQAHFSESISQLSSNMWTQVEDLVSRQAQIYSNQVEELRRQYDQQSRQIARTIHAIQKDDERKQAFAQSWIQAGESILQFISDVYDYQKFLPGKLDPLINQANLAWENLEAGIPEAALSLAQSVYLESSALRLELERLHHEWNLFHIAACERLEEVTILVEQNQKVSAINFEGHELDQEIDTNFWSGGSLNQIFNRIEELRNLLFEHYRVLSTDDLRYMKDCELPDLECAVHDCRFSARVEVLSSQIRINIADKALVALERQGFSYHASSYDRHDERGSFTATTQHPDGSEVIIKVVPSPEVSLKNDLHVYSKDAGIRTRHELRLRTETIRSTLTNAGLNLGPIAVEKDTAAPSHNPESTSRKVSEKIQKENYR